MQWGNQALNYRLLDECSRPQGVHTSSLILFTAWEFVRLSHIGEDHLSAPLSSCSASGLAKYLSDQTCSGLDFCGCSMNAPKLASLSLEKNGSYVECIYLT